MKSEFERRVAAVVEAARKWSDPEHGPREAAVKHTLEAPNRFTPEAVAFAINQQMSLLTERALHDWIGGRRARRTLTVGVLNAGNIPLVGLQDLLAVVLVGHKYVGSVSSKSPWLLKAFVEDVRRHDPELPVRFEDVSVLFDAADAVIATGSDETREWAEAQCEQHGIPPGRRLLRGHRYSAAVLNGRETEDELEGLAEDALLHEGQGCRNVALIWAPDSTAPDAFLDALASFRAICPPHPDTPGALTMQQAFLAAVDLPHAYGEGLEFLVSKGEPDVQVPGHLRWVPYGSLDEVRDWLHSHEQRLQLVVARPDVADALPRHLPTVPPGQAQRPPLDWCPDGQDALQFLTAL